MSTWIPPTVTAVLIYNALRILPLPGNAIGLQQCPVESDDEAAHIGELCVRPCPWDPVAFPIVIEITLKSALANKATNSLGKGPLRR
jgi:hypothetical protein